MADKFTALIIMDGFGFREEVSGNAIKLQGTPNLDALLAKYPNTRIGASGLSVGLPDGQMGNSEVGHLNIGAGRIVYQELTRITKSITDGDFFENPVLKAAMDNAREKGTALHLLGLLSDGGVHSHNEHLYALVEMAKKNGLDKVYVHCFMDGRDVAPISGKGFIEELEAKLKEIGTGRIASVCGRYYSMDRDNRWERVEQAYRAMVKGEGRQLQPDCIAQAIQDSYDKEEFDEFIVPTVVMDGDKPAATIGNGDSVIFFNFRPDRAREITRALTQKDFDGFDHEELDLHYVCMTQYDKTFQGVNIAFAPQTLNNTLGEYLAKCSKKQFRIAETEKYAHVTFFFNGGVEQPNDGEDRYLIPSPKVATYDLQPEMSAYEVTEKACELVRSREYDVMILNFANSDMVGHTGVLDAAKAAVRTVDECVGKVVAAIEEIGGQAIITADHGNSELMVDEETGVPFTAHTTNPVPFVLVGAGKRKLREDGILADIAPTLLEMMGLEQPAEMTGKSMLL